MRLIALDTAAGIASVCLGEDGRTTAAWRGEARCGPAVILAELRQMLRGVGWNIVDCDAIACGRGPGGFTSLRIGMALAQGLALGAGLPLVAISDLAALAWRAYREHGCNRVLACMDARRGELYRAAYRFEDGWPEAVDAEALAAPTEALPAVGEWFLAGSGTPLMLAAGITAAGADAALTPDAEAVAWLATQDFARGRILAPEAAAPVYLRSRVAVPSRRSEPRP